MTEFLVGVEDARGWKILGAVVRINDRTTGWEVASGTTDSKGEVKVSYTGTPFGNYRVSATTPKGYTGQIDFNLNWAAALAGASPVVRTNSPEEGELGATTEAWWNSLGTLGQIALVGGAALGIGLLAWGLIRWRRE